MAPNIPQLLADIPNDVILTEIASFTTAGKPDFELAFKTVGRGMPLNYALNPRF